jgi:hypothetical protein
MLPAFNIRQEVLDELDRFGIEVLVEGRERVAFANVPLATDFSAPTVEIRFEGRPGGFRVLVPRDLSYDGHDEACRSVLASRPSGRWRPLNLDPAECASFEGAVSAVLLALDSPARAALRPAARSPGGGREAGGRSSRDERSALDRFATPLTPAIERGRWPVIVERDEEIDSIEDALVQYSPGSRLVLVEGPVGSGRWSTGAIGLGQRMLDGSSRAELAGRKLYLLNPSSIFGGLMMIGELEDRILQIATETAAGGHVLFIPDSALPVLRVLPPLHDLNVVVRASRLELETWRIAAANQVGKATLVKLNPLTRGPAVAVLAAHRELLERHYRLSGLDHTVQEHAVALADEFLPEALPGAAVRVLEQACAVASRQAQRGGDGVVRSDHLLQAVRRLGGEQAAEDLLSRWFRQAVTPSESPIGDPSSRGDNQKLKEED